MIGYHLEEMKHRVQYILISLIISYVVLYSYKMEVLFKLSPLNLIFTSLTEGLYYYIYLILILTMLLNVPIIYIHIYSFRIAGLYRLEYKVYKRKVLMYSTMIIIVLSNNVVNVLPALIVYLTSLESEYLKITLKISEFVSFVNSLILFSLVVLVIPLVIQDNYKYVITRRRMLYMLTLILSGIVTPPDVLSLLLLGMPMIVIIEWFILMGVIKDRVELVYSL